MANENIKNQGSACACGRVDLYEEWLKQNEQKEMEIGTNPTDSTGNKKNTADVTRNVQVKATPVTK